jgi:hypothetical protein
MKTNFVKKIDINAKADKGCFITGMAIISEAEILFAEYDKVCLNVFNHKKGKITTTMKTSSGPADITTINSLSVATTLPEEGKIMLIDTQNVLSMSHSLQVAIGCSGIDHYSGLNAVTFIKPAAVQVLDIKGYILHQISDTSILDRPLYVFLSNDNESMYVSD